MTPLDCPQARENDLLFLPRQYISQHSRASPGAAIVISVQIVLLTSTGVEILNLNTNAYGTACFFVVWK